MSGGRRIKSPSIHLKGPPGDTGFPSRRVDVGAIEAVSRRIDDRGSTGLLELIP